MKKLTHDQIANRRFSLETLKDAERFPLTVLLDNIRSLYNVGSIFRSADGARVRKLYLSGYTPHPPRKEIEKTALGATATVPWEYIEDPLPTLEHLRSTGVRLCALEHTDGSIPYFDVSREAFPLCLIIGNEISGVSKRIIDICDMAIDIPMFGMKQSLNVSVAFGIAVYGLLHIVNQKSTS